ncbi:MAG: prolyl oligopeptidase family serine peptidase, partial [Myxococcales bacterium]|nr:prolyl oligopeptidase family serine peptidase [Myxococcales bacterium]
VLELGLPVSGAVAIVGVSQGGHATLAAAARHARYAPELDVRAFAAVAPSSVFLEQWRPYVDVSGPHQVFNALVAYAWSAHYGHVGAPIWAPARRDDIDAIMAERCLLTWFDVPTLWDVLGSDPAQIFDPAYIQALRAADFTDYPFLDEGFRANRLGPYAQTAPLRIYQGDADTVVLEAHTRALVDALRAGGVDVEYEVVPGAGHIDLAFGFVADAQARTEQSIAWVMAHLRP